jgi:hypothetical protein
MEIGSSSPVSPLLHALSLFRTQLSLEMMLLKFLYWILTLVFGYYVVVSSSYSISGGEKFCKNEEVGLRFDLY